MASGHVASGGHCRFWFLDSLTSESPLNIQDFHNRDGEVERVVVLGFLLPGCGT